MSASIGLMLFYGIIETLVILLPVLLSVAFITIIERKILASVQRRVGPNSVGYYGVLQPFADALKLITKETVQPAQSSIGLFYLAPCISLIFSLLNWGVIPFGPGFTICDYEISVLYTLALSSVGIYGVLLAGWSANSSFAFIGSLRSTAQIVSYELIIGSVVLTVIVISGSFNYTEIVESQENIWFVIPLVPLFIIWLISILAETNRTPFDLVEAESELVSGFFTEHSATVFVLFFLAEYSSIVIMSTLTSLLFLGGYNIPEIFVNNSIFSFTSVVLAIKTCFIAFFFVWIRATLPRVKFNTLITFCWTQILPLAIALVLLVPSILVAFDITPLFLIITIIFIITSRLFI